MKSLENGFFRSLTGGEEGERDDHPVKRPVKGWPSVKKREPGIEEALARS
jgi:hypothetical protein